MDIFVGQDTEVSHRFTLTLWNCIIDARPLYLTGNVSVLVSGGRIGTSGVPRVHPSCSLEGGVSTGAIVGIVLAVVALFVIIGLVVWCVLRKKRRRSSGDSGTSVVRAALVRAPEVVGGSKDQWKGTEMNPAFTPPPPMPPAYGAPPAYFVAEPQPYAVAPPFAPGAA
jgi:hypothetical protein